MRIKIVLALLIVLLGCQPKDGYKNEHTGMGYIRSYDAWHNTVVHETDSGYLKIMYLCDRSPIWKGMHVDIYFRYVNVDAWSPGCYAIDYVKHQPPDLSNE